MIELHNVEKTIGSAKILKDISLSIAAGEFVSISGRSGSGKSTLLYLLSTLDQPSGGKIKIAGHDPSCWDETELHHFRNQEIGFVFQFHYLLPELTALENILMPARKNRQHLELTARAKQLLEQFGLDGKEHSFPGQLSGGEQQRVSIARALIMQPRFIFADEPTGNLDSANGDIVMDILETANRQQGSTLILVTHEADYAKRAKREVFLHDGCVEFDRKT